MPVCLDLGSGETPGRLLEQREPAYASCVWNAEPGRHLGESWALRELGIMRQDLPVGQD